MLICKVTGSVWATCKESTLNNLKLLIVKPVTEDSEEFVAIDAGVGAGAGDKVLVVQGSQAGRVANSNNAPFDAAIVGIIDGEERYITQ